MKRQEEQEAVGIEGDVGHWVGYSFGHLLYCLGPCFCFLCMPVCLLASLLWVLQIKPRALHVPSKRQITQLHLQLLVTHFSILLPSPSFLKEPDFFLHLQF